MRLVLVRHGASLHAEQRLIAGTRSCPGLTDAGRAQVRRLAARLRRTGELDDCGLLLTSPVGRARETAAILHEALPAASLVEDARLIELDPGDADGLLWPDYEARFGAFDLVAEPDRPFAPNGESYGQMLRRVHELFEALATEHAGGTVAAVTHGGTVVASLVALLGLERPGTGARFHPANASLTEWRHDEAGWVLHRYNDTAHLDDG